ncbi:MAG: GNAT family N-acetyltransferase [Candidatus Pelethousia sp.]|nr:GNAT family N-acetyltransferase [Candidatus Pelethousia sp.]
MDFVIRKAGLNDLPSLMRVIAETTASLRQPAWFAPADEAFLAAQIQGDGFILVAQAPDGSIAGVFQAHFPGLAEENLGRDAGLWPAELPKAAHMDSVAVRPAYRGHKLQTKLLIEGEKEMAALGYRHLFCTAHPDNSYSLTNLLDLGYMLTVTVKKYGGLPRHVLYKPNGPALAALHYPGLDDYLLAMPGVQKDFKVEWQWLRYQVGGKLFAAQCTPGLQYGPHGGRTMLILKCDPLLAELYRGQYADIVPGFYSDKRNWNSVYLDAELPKDLVFAMCDHAYEQTFSKLTKKAQKEIQGA